MRGRSWAPSLALAVGVSLTSPAFAAGGGDIGGGSLPSFTKTQNDPGREYQQGMLEYQDGEFSSAVRHFENATDARTHDANAWYMLGIAKARIGDLKGAEKSLSKSDKLNPAPVATHRDLALTQVQLKEDDRARAELDLLAERGRRCDETCPEAADLKAAIAAVQQALGVISPSAALPLHGDFKFAGPASGTWPARGRRA